MNLDPLAILNALPEAALLRDADGVVRHVNPAAERLLDVLASEVVGGRELPGVSADRLAEGEAKFEIYTFEVPLSVEIVPVEGGGSLVLYRDWSWQRNLESYLATMRYELAFPLTSVRGFADIARISRGSATLEQQDEFLSLAAQGAARVRLDVMFLHDWMAYENLDVPVCSSPFELTAIMQSVLEPLQQVNDFTEIQIDTDREPPPVRCDRRRMLFVLQALFRHVINIQDHHLDITFLIEDQHLVMKCTINHRRDFYRHNFTHRDLCQRLLEQQSGAFEFTASSETTQTCTITLPIASEPPAA